MRAANELHPHDWPLQANDAIAFFIREDGRVGGGVDLVGLLPLIAGPREPFGFENRPPVVFEARQEDLAAL